MEEMWEKVEEISRRPCNMPLLLCICDDENGSFSLLPISTFPELPNALIFHKLQ